jgi:hypothetical protein
VALDATALKTQGTPEWWMQTMAGLLLDPVRQRRLATLQAYRGGCPPMPYLAPSERRGFYEFHRVARANFARRIVNSRVQRQGIRSIRTAAANDDNGDAVAWRYFTGNGLNVAAPDVHSDMHTFGETYVRVGVGSDGQPLALRKDPWSTVTLQDPLNPNVTIAAFELLWDELHGRDYAYLWLPGREYVAYADRPQRPRLFKLPGVSVSTRPWEVQRPLYRMAFNAQAFTMRPSAEEIPSELRDGGPYSQPFAQQVVPVVRFSTRGGVGVFEEHLDTLDRINHSIMQRLVIIAVQAYKQRALEQETGSNGGQVDRLPPANPNTGEPINWDEIFQPGPDALWKLPPGVKIWESGSVDPQGVLSAATADIKQLSSETGTPFPLMSDDTNQSAESAQNRREDLVFAVEDANTLAASSWARVVALMFMFAPDSDRYADNGGVRVDRADAGQIIIDWMPAERYSLAEKASADSQATSLSMDMRAAKIWQLTPDEVEINRAGLAADALLAPQPAPAVTGG